MVKKIVPFILIFIFIISVFSFSSAAVSDEDFFSSSGPLRAPVKYSWSDYYGDKVLTDKQKQVLVNCYVSYCQLRSISQKSAYSDSDHGYRFMLDLRDYFDNINPDLRPVCFDDCVLQDQGLSSCSISNFDFYYIYEDLFSVDLPTDMSGTLSFSIAGVYYSLSPCNIPSLSGYYGTSLPYRMSAAGKYVTNVNYHVPDYDDILAAADLVFDPIPEISTADMQSIADNVTLVVFSFRRYMSAFFGFVVTFPFLLIFIIVSFFISRRWNNKND